MLTEREQIFLKKSLSYANGYRELAMFDDALEELEKVEEPLRGKTEVLQMKLAILMEAKRWKTARPVANVLASRESSDPGNLINLAYVTRRASGIESANVILEKALERFPEEAIIRYNLGCYACCKGDLDTARLHLLEAFRIDSTYLEMSQTDEDLKPLADWIKTVNASES